MPHGRVAPRLASVRLIFDSCKCIIWLVYRDLPLTVASRATLLDLLRYFVNLDIVGVLYWLKGHGDQPQARSCAVAKLIAADHDHHVASSSLHSPRLQFTTRLSSKNMRHNNPHDLHTLPHHWQRLPSRPRMDVHANYIHCLLGSSPPVASRELRLEILLAICS